jgi:cytosine deaminase
MKVTMAWQDIDSKQLLLEKIKANGGWVNAHSHIDRSFTINESNWDLAVGGFEKKWDGSDEFKRNASVDDIVGHMSRVIDGQLEQGVQALGSFIDTDSVVKDKNLRAADRVREQYGKDIDIRFISEPIKGLMDKAERQWFEEAASFVDIIGGLPERDSLLRLGEDHRADHLDILFETAKKHDKPLHVQVDQLNSPDQRDTELLIEKTRQYGYKGKVAAIHCISLAAQEKGYRERIYSDLVEQDITVISCPVAWLSSRRNETLAPTHNAVTPVDEMLAAGVRVAMGTDNIADIFMPFCDGDMWIELRGLLEANRIYELESLSEIASTNGLKALRF